MSGKSPDTMFSMVCGSGGSKGRLAKAAGAEPWPDEMRHEKWHATAARSRFPSQNEKKFRVSDQFWKFRRRQMARRSGQSTFQSQNAQHTRTGHFSKIKKIRQTDRQKERKKETSKERKKERKKER